MNIPEIVILEMQNKARSLVKKLEQQELNVKRQQQILNEVTQTKESIKSDLIEVAGFLQRHNSNACENWFEELGMSK